MCLPGLAPEEGHMSVIRKVFPYSTGAVLAAAALFAGSCTSTDASQKPPPAPTTQQPKPTPPQTPPAPATTQAPAGQTRTEHDLLGEKQVPADAFYGVQTARALENFPISGVAINHYPEFVDAW